MNVFKYVGVVVSNDEVILFRNNNDIIEENVSKILFVYDLKDGVVFPGNRSATFKLDQLDLYDESPIELYTKETFRRLFGLNLISHNYDESYHGANWLLSHLIQFEKSLPLDLLDFVYKSNKEGINYYKKGVMQMILKEEIRNLFEVPDEYKLAHCISADFGMGKGIVIEFNKRYDMKNYLMKHYGSNNTLNTLPSTCIYACDKVFNLITKDKYWGKPTYDTLRKSLEEMRELATEIIICDKIAMPRIGCGLDKLEWEKVKEIINEVFEDTNIEILVCYL